MIFHTEKYWRDKKNETFCRLVPVRSGPSASRRLPSDATRAFLPNYGPALHLHQWKNRQVVQRAFRQVLLFKSSLFSTKIWVSGTFPIAPRMEHSSSRWSWFATSSRATCRISSKVGRISVFFENILSSRIVRGVLLLVRVGHAAGTVHHALSHRPAAVSYVLVAMVEGF